MCMSIRKCVHVCITYSGVLVIYGSYSSLAEGAAWPRAQPEAKLLYEP